MLPLETRLKQILDETIAPQAVRIAGARPIDEVFPGLVAANSRLNAALKERDPERIDSDRLQRQVLLLLRVGEVLRDDTTEDTARINEMLIQAIDNVTSTFRAATVPPRTDRMTEPFFRVKAREEAPPMTNIALARQSSPPSGPFTQQVGSSKRTGPPPTSGPMKWTNESGDQIEWQTGDYVPDRGASRDLPATPDVIDAEIMQYETLLGRVAPVQRGWIKARLRLLMDARMGIAPAQESIVNQPEPEPLPGTDRNAWLREYWRVADALKAVQLITLPSAYDEQGNPTEWRTELRIDPKLRESVNDIASASADALCGTRDGTARSDASAVREASADRVEAGLKAQYGQLWNMPIQQRAAAMQSNALDWGAPDGGYDCWGR